MDPAALEFLLDEIGRRFDEWETRWDRRFSPPPAMEPQDDPLICSTTTASTDEASLGPVLVRANSGDPDTPLDAIQKVTISCPEQLAVDAAASACTTTDAAHVADISLEPAVPPHLNPLVDVDFGTVTAADSADPRHQVDPVTEGLALLEYNEGASSAMVLVDTTTTSAVADVSAAQSTLRALDQMSSPAKAADDLAKPPKAALAPTREAASRATVPNPAARRRFFNNDSGAPLDSDDDSSIHGGHGSVRSHFLECETGNAFLPYRTATDASDPARLDPYSLALPQPQAEVVDAPNRDEASPLPPVYDDRPDLFLQAGYVQGLPLEWLGLARSAADRDALATAHRHGSELSCQLYRRPAESGEDPGEEYDEALFYENIQAPKFVDLTAPDAGLTDDDRAGFYLRMGCDQNHEQVDPEALDRNFFARVAKLSHTAHICADHEVCEVLPLSVPAAWVNVGKLSLSVCWKIPWPPPTHSRLTLDESGLSLCNCKLDFLTTDSPIIVAVLPYWKIDFWCKIIPRQRQAENAVMLLRNTVEELIMKYKEIEVEILRVEVGGCNDVIFCKVADHMEKVASPFVRNTASLGGNLVIAQRDQFASDIATILLAARSSMCIQASPKRLTVTMEDFLQMPPCDHKTLLLSSYIPRWTLIGGLLSGDKTMFGTESKIETSVLFGGRQNWKQREESFKLNSTMKVHCGFMKKSGADMDIIDLKYIQKCKIVVASGIFYDYDIPHQPSNNSHWSQKLFCFLMVVDEVSLDFVQKNTTVKINFSVFVWDPGGSNATHRLEGKPKLKKGGMSGSWLDHYMGLGPWPVEVVPEPLEVC